jgi:ferrochelatase
MTTGVLLLNFGEPAEPDREAVLDYLERIFLANARLEKADTEAEKRDRARELARRRAPGLIEEYEEIGGSPLNPQAKRQTEALESEHRDRGYDARTYLGAQYTEPFVADAVEAARADGVDELVGLPIYPLCGPSTTVQSLKELEEALGEAGWEPPVHELTGWHKHPAYNHIRVDNVRSFVREHGLNLADPDAELVFSAHGTPRHYLEEGSRYERYVEEFCASMARMLGVDSYTLGYQNHENRDIPWTEPEVEDAIAGVDAERVVVEPVSFMHEQSETLSELDVELAEEAEAAGLDFHRVPIPHDDDRFPELLADLTEPFLAGVDPGYYNLRPCLCRGEPGAVCLNATRNRELEGDIEPAYPAEAPPAE